MEQLILEQLVKLSEQMGQFKAEIRAEMREGFAEVNQKFKEQEEKFNKKFEKIDQRFKEQDEKFAEINKNFVEINKKFDDNIIEIADMFGGVYRALDTKSDKSNLKDLKNKDAVNYY